MEFGSVYSVTFSHGAVTPKTEHQFRCEITSEIKNPHTVKKIIASDSENQLFSGYRDETPLVNDCILIRNRKTNSIRLFTKEHFILHPYWPSHSENLQSATATTVNTRDLNKAFGSKKIKRRLTQSEKVNANLGNVEKSMKTAIEQNELIVDTEITTKVVPNEAYLPPCDRNAKLVEAVYKVEDLVSHEILTELEGLTQQIIRAENIQQLATDSRLSPFFFKAIVHVPKISLKMKLLLFADSLVKLMKEPARVLKSKTPIVCSYSPSINMKLLNEFCVSSVGGMRIRTPSMRDKALCYIMVILLIICEFTADISLLSGIVTRAEYNRLPMLMKAIGAREVKNQPTVFHLKLPLSRLPLNRGRMKRVGKNQRSIFLFALSTETVLVVNLPKHVNVLGSQVNEKF